MAARFMVISFQRSGLNWLRYCTEYFTGTRTPGRPQIIAEGPVFFDRAHDVRLKAKKGVFYFEDFVSNEEGTVRFLRFFDIDPAAHPYDFNEMIEASRGWYRGHHGFFAARERPQLKPKERTAILRMLKQELGENFARYLGRYSLCN